MRTRFALVFAFTAGTFLPVAALAEEPVASDIGQQETAEPPAEYKEAVQEAVGHSSQEDWEQARTAFERAHALFPNARTLRGIGIVSFEMKDYRAAYRNLLAALLEKRRALTEAQDTEVREFLKKTEKLLGRYTTRHLPSNAIYSMDGESLALESNGTLLVPQGEHTITARLEDGSESSGQLTVRGGEVGPLPLEFKGPEAEPTPAPAATPEPQGPAAEPPAEPPAQIAPAHKRSPLPTIAMATGGVLLVTGVVLFAIGQNDIAKVESAEGGTEWHTLESRNNRAPVLTGLGAGLAGAGAAVGITGLALHFSAAPTETGFNLGVSGSW